ncbi:MAG: nucleoside phosphorylase [Candidatus Nanopelagicaceae bacterium]|nr:nucleoside phosphorylase [Candidatus Nanopelagicaceae bacterium]
MKQYHTHTVPGDVGKYVLLPGDPGRVPLIAAHLEDAKHIATNREYVTYTGWLDGEKVSVTSTGIGCPSSAIAVEELYRCGADTFIRVGTSGSLQPGTKSNDLAIVTGAIRHEGTSSHYMPIEFPAVCDLEVVTAMRTAVNRLGVRYQVGISHSKDSFYGEVEPERSAISEELKDLWRAWQIGGAICSEMEISTICVVSSILRARAGGIMAMHGEGEFGPLDGLIVAAVESVKELIKIDKERGR